MTRSEALEYFREELKDSKCSDTCVICNAKEWAIKALEQPDIIRCKDCMWYEIYQLKKDGTDDHRHKPSFCTLYNRLCDPDWFCADGMREIEKNEENA